MRQAQKVLMIIAAVCSIIVGIIMAAVVVPTTLAVIARNDAGESVPFGAIYLIVMTAAMIINIFLCFFGKNSKSPVILVLNIIFGIISNIWINAVGAIFGFIANAQGK